MKTKSTYKSRRDKLASSLPASSVAIIPSASEIIRNGDVHYRFRQDSDFYYLTGFNEPDALLVIFSGNTAESILFNRANDELLEQWTGKRLGQTNAPNILGVDHAFAIDMVDGKLPELLSDRLKVYLPLRRYSAWDERILSAWTTVKGAARRGKQAPESFCDITAIIGEMRLIKCSDEQYAMRMAAEASVAAHKRAMMACKTACYEYELEAEIIAELTRRGCRSYSYDPIVASGENACVLHYTDNNQLIKKDALVLIDAGGEFDNYAADITRTFPANGIYSAEQKLIYELVLEAQKAAFKAIRPGASWNDMQDATVKVLTSGLIDLGILKGNLDALIEDQAYSQFYMHRFGHWLGLDVHDCGRYKNKGAWRKLEPNMAFTVEPGLYINNNTSGVDKRWHGIGVRIEDDVIVTRDGFDNITKDLPTEIVEIEALLRG